MILIADGGATKTTWSFINNAAVFNFETEGYHPFFVDAGYIAQSLQKALPPAMAEHCDDIEKIFFYSTGAGYSKETDAVLREGITPVFPGAEIFLETDLLAAARALLQKDAGFAAILGTGSNSGMYDGTHIITNIESGGFLLGDEGSGAYLGKMVLIDYIRGYMPEALKQIFEQRYQLTPESLINEVYTSKTPNQYCARFARFAADHIDMDYCRELAITNFDDFFKKMITHYKSYRHYSINTVGSVAYYLKDIFTLVAARYEVAVGNIFPSAIEGLTRYHRPFQ
ncbi:N-acetylglucosamine kinase [Niabella soli]|uniref:N-acetylglucosamine kinase n=1 Tax=Niabella soli DSM 19437 TaxID=929713 RepID=W0EY31_9BACT|nr:N-acetylglucosamine kinase [Niabella soli]AHF14483.1 N-acetylglucosamine kinase [Niabella soli DSM 19437]